MSFCRSGLRMPRLSRSCWASRPSFCNWLSHLVAAWCGKQCNQRKEVKNPIPITAATTRHTHLVQLPDTPTSSNYQTHPPLPTTRHTHPFQPPDTPTPSNYQTHTTPSNYQTHPPRPTTRHTYPVQLPDTPTPSTTALFIATRVAHAVMQTYVYDAAASTPVITPPPPPPTPIWGDATHGRAYSPCVPSVLCQM